MHGYKDQGNDTDKKKGATNMRECRKLSNSNKKSPMIGGGNLELPQLGLKGKILGASQS